MSYLPDFDTAADEKELFATLLYSGPAAAERIVEMVDPADFANPLAAEMWGVARRICAEGRRPDYPTLLGEYAGDPARGRMDRLLKGGLAGTGDPPGLKDRVARIREARRREKIARALESSLQAVRLPHVDLENVQEHVLSEMLSLDDGPDGPVHIGAAIRRLVDAQRSVSADRVIRTPWLDLNDVLAGGLHRGNLYTVAGRLGEGKSHVGLVLAAHAAEKHATTVVFSQEMSELEVTGRWVSRAARVNLSNIQAYQMSVEERGAAEELTGTTDPLFIVDRPGLSAAAAQSMVRRFQRRHDVRLVVLDYCQLFKPENVRQDRHLQVAEVACRAREMARELDVVVLMLAQLNRGPESRADKRPVVSDLRESDVIAQESSTVILIHPIEEGALGAAPLRTGEIEFIVGKNRHGRSGSVTVRQEFEYANLR